VNQRSRQQRMRALRDDYDHAERARGLAETATGPFNELSDAERARLLAVAGVHSSLAVAAAVDQLSSVLDAVWAQAARELVAFRSGRQQAAQAPVNGAKANGEGRTV
jgi:hypothetical protein